MRQWRYAAAADLCAERGEFDGAVEELRRVRAKPDLDDPLASAVANDLAWALALRRGEEDLAEADRLSSEAQAALGELPPVQSTRGMVLLELGRIEQARPVVERRKSPQRSNALRLQTAWNGVDPAPT